MPIYRNIRIYPIQLENATTGKQYVIYPGDTIELPTSFAAFYSHVLEEVKIAPVVPDEPVISSEPIYLTEGTEEKEETVEEEIQEEDIPEENTENNEDVKEDTEIEVKRGRGRPKKPVEVEEKEKRGRGRPKKVSE